MAFALLILQAPDLPGGIIAVVNRFTDFLLSYVAALAAIGALAMALIEGWKKFWDARTKFQAKRFTSWVHKSLPEAVLTRSQQKPTPVVAISDVLQLCTGVSKREASEAANALARRAGRLPPLHAFQPDPAHALFALEIERMMGAIQEAADVALMSPTKYPALYAFLTAGGEQADVDQWFEEAESGLTEMANLDKPGAKERQQVKELSDRAARLRQVIKRKLDSFQLFTADRWASYNQSAAIVVGFILMFGVLTWMREAQAPGAPSMLAIVPLSLIGGIFSPIAKDLVTSLKRVRHG